MKQAIAGVYAASEHEVTVMKVWPSVAAMSLGPFPLGRMLGQLYSIKAGIGVFTIGNLFCLLTIPLALILYFKRIGPLVATRYQVTNNRIIVERGMTSKEERAIELDGFDHIEIQIEPGQEWYVAGNLVFSQGKIERFRLNGVSRPEAFKAICEKACMAYSGVKQAVQQQGELVSA